MKSRAAPHRRPSLADGLAAIDAEVLRYPGTTPAGWAALRAALAWNAGDEGAVAAELQQALSVALATSGMPGHVIRRLIGAPLPDDPEPEADAAGPPTPRVIGWDGRPRIAGG